jgi:uncharacterized protein (DUF1501 family)
MSRSSRTNDRNATRREFLWQGACAALTATGIADSIWNLRMINAATAAAATQPSPYKALVCIFLFGGNDGNNLLIATDDVTDPNPALANRFTKYKNARGVLALAAPGATNGILPLSATNVPSGQTYGIHPNCPELAGLFNVDGKLALLANVGTLLAPATKADYTNRTSAIPPQLFSHSDQQIEWQTNIEDQPPKTGWGGRTADLLYSMNSSNSVAMNISLAGTNTYQVGNVVQEYSVSPGGAVSLNIPTNTAGMNELAAFRKLLVPNYPATQPSDYYKSHPNLYEGTFAEAMDASLLAASSINTKIAGTAAANFFTTPFPASSLGQQLKMIARLIAAAPALGHNRQIFFAAAGGFDLHSNEGVFGGSQGKLLADVSASMNALYRATVQLGVGDSVTQFTGSDFSRTFLVNGGSGADHGWGNNHLILGGAVKGKQVYGTYPDLTLSGPSDTGTGRWIPTTSVDQYSATLASWFGVSSSLMPNVFPYLGRFASSNLGFI